MLTLDSIEPELREAGWGVIEGSNVQKSYTSSNSKTQSSSTTKNTIDSRCTGKTKSGARCMRKTKNASGKCYQLK